MLRKRKKNNVAFTGKNIKNNNIKDKLQAYI